LEWSGGLSASARGYSGADANLWNGFIDDNVLDGNHVYNYNTDYPALPGVLPRWLEDRRALVPPGMGHRAILLQVALLCTNDP
jgi:hypothetical protein